MSVAEKVPRPVLNFVDLCSHTLTPAAEVFHKYYGRFPQSSYFTPVLWARKYQVNILMTEKMTQIAGMSVKHEL